MKHFRNSITRDWFEQGRAEGRAEARAKARTEGAADQLNKMLEHRFGALADSVERRIRAASVDELNDWAVAVLDAETLDDVFANGASSA